MDLDYTRRNKKPRLLSETEREKLDEFVDSIHYSSRYATSPPEPRFWEGIRLTVCFLHSYNDDHYEYRHVQLPKQMLKAIPKDYFDGSRGTLKLLWEDEWRGLGITQVRRPRSVSLWKDQLMVLNRVLDGSTTKSTSQNHTSYYLSK